jgi:beta-phosphoglucomutase-like phosphatase (HAD superfamily)
VIDAVVFDFDGTVFDSETHEYEVIREIFAEHGAELPLELWGQCVGREAGYFDPIAYLREQTGRQLDPAALKRLRTERFYRRIEGAGAIPGVAEALAAARALRLRIGLASSSGAAWVRGQLGRLELLDFFDCVRTRTTCRR